MSTLEFLIKALAVYRLAHMMALETGPLALFERGRAWASDRWRIEWVMEGVACPLCISFWLGIVVALLPWSGLVVYFCTALALSAVTVALETRGEK